MAALISKETLEKIRKDNEERSKGGNYVKTPCVEIMTISDFEVGVREKGKIAGRPFIRIEFSFDGNRYSPLEEEFILTGDEGWVQYGLSKMTELFSSAGHVLTEVNDQDHLKLLASKHLKGKKVTVAVKVKQTIWRKEGNKPIIVHNAEPWYYGPVSNYAAMKEAFNEARAFEPISEAEKQELENWGKSDNPSSAGSPVSVTSANESGGPAATPISDLSGLDDLP